VQKEILTDNIICFHCGEICKDASIHIEEKIFCCNGCKTVYEILEENNLCNYYTIESSPGINKRLSATRNFDFLDDETVISRLIDFADSTITTITFSIPQMHCSSCIWILENLYKLNPGIKFSEVNFLKKNLSVRFNHHEITLKQLVELLDSIGYLPLLNLEDKKTEKENRILKNLYYKVGVSGFAFGNIMLLSFPEYLSLQDIVTDNLKNIFLIINFLLSLPVVFYSSSEYYLSAYKGLKKKIFNIDVPISFGILVLFCRSVYEILLTSGPGYFDSLAGLVFFLLLGKLFQNKTYDTLNFERNYKSYFPIAVTISLNGSETTIPAEKIKVGQRIIIHNGEILPADSVLISNICMVDYSFVTGESTPVEKINGDLIYAGGKIIGASVEVETIKDISQSYLTQLWNSKVFSKPFESKINSLVNIVSKYFTFAVLFIAFAGFVLWVFVDANKAFNAFTAVLIIACPCALALSTPFTLGNTMRIFGRNKFYIKNVDVIERLAKTEHIVFDKTGTITESGISEISFIGKSLSENEKNIVYSLTKNSSHPLSKLISSWLNGASKFLVEDYDEIPGKGISGKINNIFVMLGSSDFVGVEKKSNYPDNENTKVFLSFNNELCGYFSLKNKYREGLKETAKNLLRKYKISVITGDNSSEEKKLREIFSDSANILFNQSPFDKHDYIKKIQFDGEKVLMLGDGLNDAGALSQSDVGISISENINNFSPACDGIIDSKSFFLLNDFISFSQTSMKIIIISFVISFLYNIVGFYFALKGDLSPVIAAVLMPLSSVSVVVFTTFATNIKAKQKGLLRWK
jgi:Cu+-exporting ATPase